MPNVCQGRPPDGVCPENRCDDTVTHTQGDLFLCKACEEARFPSMSAEEKKKAIARVNELAGTTVLVTRPTVSKPSGPTITYYASKSSSKPSTTSSSSAAGEGLSAVTRSSTSSASSSDIPTVTVINELLTYVCHYRNKAPALSLRQCVVQNYLPLEIMEAKKLLVGRFNGKVAGSPLITERRNSTVRPAHEAEVEDIIGLLDLLDADDSLRAIKFAAVDLERLPKYGPGEINLAYVMERNTKLDGNVAKLTAELADLRSMLASSGAAAGQQPSVDFSDSVLQLSKKFDDFAGSVDARIQHLNIVCEKMGDTVNVPRAGSGVVTSRDEVDRSLNIVVFGIDENRDASVWRRSVDEALKYIIGREVDIVDSFRLGSFRDGKKRPILLKLRTVWDKRLILQGTRKLKDYPGRVFISPDEPVDVRRKKLFDRLKYRANRDGKSVNVVDGILIIDDVPTFSLSEGFLNHQNNDES